ncbi:MAG: hypothetical protein H8E63_00400 [Proteobacteria bacterium]|nr:hypothetical protein [Pseudomonadota bacterium]
MVMLPTFRAIVLASVLAAIASPAFADRDDDHRHEHDHREIYRLQRENDRLRRDREADVHRERERRAKRERIAIRLDAALAELNGVRSERALLEGSLGAAQARQADAEARYRAVSSAAAPIEAELRSRRAVLTTRLQDVRRIENELAAEAVIAGPVRAVRQALESARKTLSIASEDAKRRIATDPVHTDLKVERAEVAAELQMIAGQPEHAQRVQLVARAIMQLDERISASADRIAGLDDEREAVRTAEAALARAEAEAWAKIHGAPLRIAAMAHADRARAGITFYEREHAAVRAAVSAADAQRRSAGHSVASIEGRMAELNRRARSLESEVSGLKGELSRS